MTVPIAHRQRGFLLTDAIVGLLLVGVLTAGLTVAVHQQRDARRVLRQKRAALRVAETALGRLHRGEPVRSIEDQGRITVRAVESAARSPAEGQQWVRVTARRKQTEVSLVGLIPAEAMR